MFIHNTKSNEIISEIIAFLMLFSQQAKKEGKRHHHLTVGHLQVMLAIPESFKNGQHLVESFSSSKVFDSFQKLGYDAKYSAFKRNLDELVRLGFLNKQDGMYSYSIHLSKQNVDNNMQLN